MKCARFTATMKAAYATSMFVFASFAACVVIWADDAVRSIDFPQVVSSSEAHDRPLFERLGPEQTGVHLIVPIDKQHPLKRVYTGGFSCGNVALGDVDRDGQVDLYVVSGPGTNRLYRQRAPFEFEDITEQAHVDGADAWGVGASMVDIDNDGDLDIYVCNYDYPNMLYINNGHGVFEESASRWNLDLRDSSLFAAFCDYDRDGDLDAYLVTNRLYQEGGLPADLRLNSQQGHVSLPLAYRDFYDIMPTGRHRGQLATIARSDRLLRNDGDHFTDTTRVAGMRSEPDHGLAATWWDFDRDGWLDLYVSNDFNDPDHLYHNQGNGTFADVLGERLPHTAWFSMGSDAGDINNDGRLDLFVADMSATTHFDQKTTMGAMGKNAAFLENTRPPQYMRNTLFLNTGTSRFLEIAYQAGVDSSDWTWSTRFADLDSDGWLDLFVTNGMTRNLNDSDLPFTLGDQLGGTKWDLYENLPPLRQQNLAFRNQGNLQFHEQARAWGLDHVGMSFAAAMGDIDRDGHLDLVVANLDEPPSIYRNRGASGNRITVKLQATRGHRDGWGAMLRLTSAHGTQTRQLLPTSGYLGSHESLIHFGLGEQVQAERLEIDWPSGFRQVIAPIAANRHYEIREVTTETSAPEPPAKTWFQRSSDGLSAEHHEVRFDDFARQPLLPFRLSQLGPGMACGDADGDGDDDLFVGGASGQAGSLWWNQGPGAFAQSPTSFPFSLHAAREDMGALFLDVDGDDDQDLYIVGGGIECDVNDDVLNDRLYLNLGHGRFIPAPADALPVDRSSDSVVCAADFDRDGDLDLFIGGRTIPGQYPLAPASRLLRNVSGRFEDVTASVASELAQAGMVTSGLWSDVDSDGWIDLLAATEWGPIRWYRNDQGQLREHTNTSGLAEQTGWWTGLAGRDLDHDGDIDYVATNFGRNTKYHASMSQPALIYYGDFDDSGRSQIVEAEFEHDKLFPVRGRSCSSHAIPVLRERFDSYKSFAMADLAEIYTPQRLEQSRKFAATQLDAVVFINDGQGRFTVNSLPWTAQVAPSFGVALTDVDGDGHTDAYLVQNYFQPQVETGRMDGGISTLLRGRGDGTFEPIGARDSGLIVPADARSLVVLDANQDTRPDFVVGVNDGATQLWQSHVSASGSHLVVRLRGPRGNPTSVGARVTLRRGDILIESSEVTAGGGYLSQSTANQILGCGESTANLNLEVHWPHGAVTSHPIAPDASVVTLDDPKR